MDKAHIQRAQIRCAVKVRTDAREQITAIAVPPLVSSASRSILIGLLSASTV